MKDVPKPTRSFFITSHYFLPIRKKNPTRKTIQKSIKHDKTSAKIYLLRFQVQVNRGLFVN